MEQYGFPVTDTRPFRSAGVYDDPRRGAAQRGHRKWLPLAYRGPPACPSISLPTAPDGSGAQLAARAMQAGAFVGIAHPHWYTLTAVDVDALGPAHAVEVYNGVAADANDRGRKLAHSGCTAGQAPALFRLRRRRCPS